MCEVDRLEKGWVCDNPSTFALWNEKDDSTGACGKHLARMITLRLPQQQIQFVKVTRIK